MNTIRHSPPRWQLVLVFVVFVGALGLAFYYRELIKETVLVPILYFLWVADLALTMFGQYCVWWVALLVALILSLAFSRRKERPVMDLDRTVYGRGPAEGRIHYWRRRVRVNSGAINAVSYRRSEMRQLVIRALAYQENSSIQDVEEQLRSGQISVPADVGAILGLGDRAVEVQKSIGLMDSIKLRLEWIKGRFVSSQYLPDPRIEMIAEYLENIMEVDNGARNH